MCSGATALNKVLKKEMVKKKQLKVCVKTARLPDGATAAQEERHLVLHVYHLEPQEFPCFLLLALHPFLSGVSCSVPSLWHRLKSFPFSSYRPDQSPPPRHAPQGPPGFSGRQWQLPALQISLTSP